MHYMEKPTFFFNTYNTFLDTADSITQPAEESHMIHSFDRPIDISKF